MNKRKKEDAIQKAIDYGLDVTLLYERVALTPTERIERHQQSLEFAKELKKAGERKVSVQISGVSQSQ